MKWGLLTGGLCLAFHLSFAQMGQQFGSYHRLSVTIPESLSYSADSIARYLREHYKTPKLRLQALYSWITTHIRYNNDSSYYYNRSLDYEEKIAATLRRKKGVCENYADLLADLASRIGLRSHVVYGYITNGATRRTNAGHAWCAIYVDDDWWLFDPTWDAGNLQQNSLLYFMAQPSQFIQSHMPFDPIWQLLEHPVSYRNSHPKDTRPFYYKDSINAFLAMDSLHQFIAIERRMKESGANNELFKLWQSYNRMNIAIIAGEMDMELYNDAVDRLNDATEIFNSFVRYRNNAFLPQKKDEELRLMLEPINSLITEALQKLDQIGLLVENFQYNTEAIRRQLLQLHTRYREQKAFLSRYLASETSERARLFYQ